ncbi:MAG: DEAD/DEAH box helicase [Actinomycetota bacterium]
MFPTAAELQDRLAEAEIEMFLQRGSIDDGLLATAWYLHAVGSVRPALQLYSIDRQLRANQVAAHIFDLALASGERAEAERQELTFAAQVSYLRGGLDPNALALYRRLQRSHPRLSDSPGEVSLDIGSALLALDRYRLFPLIEALRAEAGSLRAVVGVADLIDTPYGSAARVIEGCNELIVHLTYNQPDRLGRAQRLFDEAVDPPHAKQDLISRWVAAHLRDIADDLGSSSVWAHLPPSIPPAAARAMTLGDPPVLSLWPPQLDLLRMTPSPLGPDTKRLMLSFPTSAGKTLIAQYIVAAHIASGAGAACVVVPTHSLGRELQRDLDRRLATMGVEVADAGPLGLPLPEGRPAVVMTPEKLAAHLRNEPERVLRDFSLFVIDEAHLLGDADRGWVLESALSLLHEATLHSSHRIVLLSAALGNRAHICSWLSVGSTPAQAFHHEWRGPRRAHALLGTDAVWDNAELIQQGARARLVRRRVPLHGQIHVRTAPGKHRSLRTTEPIGTLLQALRDGDWKREATGSDPAYRMRARMATLLGTQGSVLIIEPTKAAAQRTAGAVADELEDEPECAALVALATTRLGVAHPLVATLRGGVGFHHAALPDDVQAELEDGIRRGPLRYLVATTTLIEGINFPVRSVLVGDRGYQTADGFVTTLDAPKLLNAVGRGGRAGRETEGWIVLWLNEQFTPSAFDALAAEDADLTANSRLSTEDALDALASFEELVRRGQDAVFETDGNAVSDFISHVWFIATAVEDLQLAARNPVRASLESTLAWQQLAPADRERWRAVAELAADRYERAPREQRRRWARTGTSLPSAAKLETLAGEIRVAIATLAVRSDPVDAFGLVAGGGRLASLLDLSESRSRLFRPRRNSPISAALDVDLHALIGDWLKGTDLDQLGMVYLAVVQDETYRYEQLSEFISQVLEHLLPWLLNTVIAWVNEGLDGTDQLCPELPAYVRFGVDKPVALELARAGVRSRRLVHVVANVAERSAVSMVRDWLSESGLQAWGRLFDASPSELADLLFFTRARDARITSRVLAGEIVDVPLIVEAAVGEGPVELREADEPAPQRLAVFRDDELVGYVRSEHQDDITRLRAIGVPLIVSLGDPETMRIRIDDPTNRAAWFTSP